jgi:hypothetical protein
MLQCACVSSIEGWKGVLTNRRIRFFSSKHLGAPETSAGQLCRPLATCFGSFVVSAMLGD